MLARRRIAVLETEIKLRWTGDAASAYHRLETLGYSPSGPRLLEADQLFDRESGDLSRGAQTLRLRKSGGRATATYKGPPKAGPYKSREEIEFDVSDAEAFETVLARLGYQRAFRYEKFRTKYSAGEGLITVDETPVGNFLELEGPGYWIDETATRLGFSRDQYSTASYAAIYREFRSAHADAPKDMVFADR
jgi:adenylate cyclase class 2